jgi:hypothetical protein
VERALGIIKSVKEEQYQITRGKGMGSLCVKSPNSGKERTKRTQPCEKKFICRIVQRMNQSPSVCR